MTLDEFKDNHETEYGRATQTDGREVTCPCCGAVSDTYYKSAITFLIVGCENCINTIPYYEMRGGRL